MILFQNIKKLTGHFMCYRLQLKKAAHGLTKPFYAAANYCKAILVRLPYIFFVFTRYRKYYHQYRNDTCENRYPELFAICKEYFKDSKDVKILSFGCSTGEEVYSIHSYLPQAHIIGTDLNSYNLWQCRKKGTKENIHFMHGLSEEYQQTGNFDAIFCMAVLQHINNRQGVNIATKFTFQQFEKQLMALDEKLKVGGLLFIDKTDFDFLQTSICKKYTPLNVVEVQTVINRPLFNSSNVKISETNNCHRVFLKKG
jgi:hypothetical protein